MTTKEKVLSTILQVEMYIKKQTYTQPKSIIKPDASVIKIPAVWSTQNVEWFKATHQPGKYQILPSDIPSAGKVQLDFSGSGHDELFLNWSEHHDSNISNILQCLENLGYETYSGLKPTEMSLDGLFGIAWYKGKNDYDRDILHRIATRQIFGYTFADSSKRTENVTTSGYTCPVFNNQYTLKKNEANPAK